MNLYIVDVDCHYRARLKTGTHRPERPILCEHRSFILEAENVHEAEKKGMELADATAACSEEWVKFVWRKTMPFSVPVEIQSGARFMKPTSFASLKALHK